MHRTKRVLFPHPFNRSRIVLILVLLGTATLSFSQGKKPSANDINKAKIDSLFADAEKLGLNTKGKLRYDFSFADPDAHRIELFSARMQKDSFEVVAQKTVDKMTYLRLSKNTHFTPEELLSVEQKIRWVKYNFFIDDYNGFSIHPADPDPIAVPEAEFLAYLKALSNEDLYWVGTKLWRLQSYDKALNALEMGVSRAYRPDTTRYRYGQVLVATNEFNDAINQWKRAVEYNPNYLEVFLDLGHIHFENGYFKEALDYYQKADALKPNDPAILLHIAESLYPLERYNQSLTYAKRSYKLDHKNAFTKSLIQLLNEPRIKYLRKKFPEK